ncbi:Rieske (2Fe-2S) protein [Candidatus Marinimicrobia bacterium MT.SAG.4]|nr:Rieske (2Fe-2S) protein [Candidatus Marinimicrobia bacterium MT.SAG.4]
MSYTRRKFIKLASSGIAGGMIAGSILGCATATVYQGSLNRNTLEFPLSDFNENIGDNYGLLVTAFDLSDAIILIKDAEGEFLALSARCTHQGCQVKVKRQSFNCSCHGSAYDGYGNVIRGPAQKRLRSFPVKILDGIIKINLI